tara:strand:- start:488 stop:1369 length:882 start_codon:yes stop_codon:yes gene_type:complete
MNFNRRQNRIAGPGFHINVRYDDQMMAKAHSTASMPHKSLNLGRNHLENFDVKEQELLVCKRGSSMYHDGYTHCISSANGFSGSGDSKVVGLDNEALAEWVLSQVQFVGVATTEYKPSRAYSEQGFVAQVGGVTTLINEGESVIKPGDKVALGLNLKIGRKTARDKGIPRDKIRFCLVKAGNSRANIAKALDATGQSGSAPASSVRDAQKAVADAEKNAKKNKDPSKQAGLDAAVQKAKSDLASLSICRTGVDGMVDFLNKYQELNERVIGKAASYARPGDRLEVILQPRNPY